MRYLLTFILMILNLTDIRQVLFLKRLKVVWDHH